VLLATLLKDDNPNVRTHATYALANQGAAALPHMAEALKAKDDQTRIAALNYLMQQGASAKIAAPTLIEALKSSNPQIRWMAAATLGNIGADAAAAVPALTEA